MQAFAPSAEDNLGLRLQTQESSALVYASAMGAIADPRRFDHAGAWFVDGTFWSEEELPGMGVPMGPARSMAHQPVGGPSGSLQALRGLDAPRRIFTHVNNTNPLLDESSAERRLVLAAGWEVATDGLLLRVD
jgi:pyrroloquinoline quinone biosynthesis protein B